MNRRIVIFVALVIALVALAASWRRSLPAAALFAGSRVAVGDVKSLPVSPVAVEGESSTTRRRSLGPQCQVPLAAVESAVGSVSAAESVMPAEIGKFDMPSARSRDSGSTKDSQSDAESPDPFASPVGAVAPVPMHEEGLAAVNVPLAAVGAGSSLANKPLAERSGTSRVAKAVLMPPLALIAVAEFHQLNTLPADLTNESEVAGSPERVSIESGALLDSEPQVSSGLARGWPLIDEAPICDPSVLLENLSVDDPLRCVIQNWAGGETTNKSDVAVIPAGELDRRIEQSPLPFRTLFEMGRLSALLDEKPREHALWRAAAFAMAREPLLEKTDPRDVRCMEVLAGSALWNWRDDGLAVKALAVLLKMEAPGTRRFAQATVFYANALDRLHDAREQELIEPLRQIVSEKSAWSTRDRFEMRCVLGRALFRQHRYLEGFAEVTGALRDPAVSIF